MASADDVRRMFDEIEAHLGKVDRNGKQRRYPTKVMPLAQHSDELFEQNFNIHARSQHHQSRPGRGRRIVISGNAVGKLPAKRRAGERKNSKLTIDTKHLVSSIR